MEGELINASAAGVGGGRGEGGGRLARAAIADSLLYIQHIYTAAKAHVHNEVRFC